MTQTTERRRATVTLPSDREILISRDFAAPPHRLYRAWTEPDLVRRWWHANRGTLTEVTIDLRVGGAWRYVMALPGDRGEIAWHGAYVEIVPGERVSCTAVFEPFPDNESVETVSFIPIPGGTRVEIHVLHDTTEARDAHIASGMEDGLNDALELAEELANTIA